MASFCVIAIIAFFIASVAGNDSDDYLLAVGGFPWPPAELVPLGQDDPLDCVTPAAHPEGFLIGSAAAVLDGKVTICGGFNKHTNIMTSACYQYDPAANSWSHSGSMSVEKYMMGYDSDSDWGLVMAGGRTYAEVGSTGVERTSDGSSFVQPAPLPLDMSYYCLAIVDSDRLFVSFWGATFVYSATEDSWTQVSGMPTARGSHSCKTVVRVDGTKELIAAGGFDGENFLGVVEIYDVEGDAWRAGPQLPHAVYLSAAPAYGGSFLLAAGFDGECWTCFLDGIYQYDKESESWILLEQKLTHARDAHVALTVGSSMFPNCRTRNGRN